MILSQDKGAMGTQYIDRIGAWEGGGEGRKQGHGTEAGRSLVVRKDGQVQGRLAEGKSSRATTKNISCL